LTYEDGVKESWLKYTVDSVH